MGFVIIKPIKDKNDNPLIGRTLLKPYHPINESSTDGSPIYEHYLAFGNEVSLYGITLGVESVPFQAQDQGVSACATIALWTVLRTLTKIFSMSRLSPVEITEASTSYPTLSRIFPQTGLSIEQMITGMRSVDLDVEVLNIMSLQQIVLEKEILAEILPTDHVVTTAIKAYLKMDIPLIATLSLKTDDKLVGHHAIVITGYQCDSDENITEIYVHDDQIGPYSKVLPDGDFRRWNSEWVTSNECDTVELDHLLVPVLPKVRQVFTYMYNEYLEAIKKLHPVPYEYVKLFLSSVQKYKKELLLYDFDHKTEVLTKSLPRYLWIIRVSNHEQIIRDYVYDGTATYISKLLTVKYPW